jgi:hypothetical protein
LQCFVAEEESEATATYLEIVSPAGGVTADHVMSAEEFPEAATIPTGADGAVLMGRVVAPARGTPTARTANPTATTNTNPLVRRIFVPNRLVAASPLRWRSFH